MDKVKRARKTRRIKRGKSMRRKTMRRKTMRRKTMRRKTMRRKTRKNKRYLGGTPEEDDHKYIQSVRTALQDKGFVDVYDQNDFINFLKKNDNPDLDLILKKIRESTDSEIANYINILKNRPYSLSLEDLLPRKIRRPPGRGYRRS